MRISVIQPGARLHYAVPAVFARAGVLRALLTDVHGEHALVRAADALWPHRLKPKALRRLLGRRLPQGLSPRLVHDRPLATLVHAVAAAAGGRGVNRCAVSQRLLADLERMPLGKGDIVYTALVNEDLETMRRLKERGVGIVHECIVNPDVGKVLADERRLFPGVDLAGPACGYEEGMRRDAQKYLLSDLVLVPSAFTRRAVQLLAPDDRVTALVPYGFEIGRFAGRSDPEPGRVLAVGSARLLKGTHYLAAAARRLQAQGAGISVRVVGPTRGVNLGHPALAGPVYVGQVPRPCVVDEFTRADVFVFPTICDSFGIVLVEALAAGVPVVCTTNCGDVVRDGIDGFIVPPRDPEALAERIRQIVEDRDLRERMSRNAVERAQDFSLEAYARRLLSAVEGLEPCS